MQTQWNLCLHKLALVKDNDDLAILSDYFQEKQLFSNKIVDFLRSICQNNPKKYQLSDFVEFPNSILVQGKSFKLESKITFTLQEYKEDCVLYTSGSYKSLCIYLGLSKGSHKQLSMVFKEKPRKFSEFSYTYDYFNIKISNIDDFINKVPTCLLLKPQEIFDYFLVLYLQKLNNIHGNFC